MWDGRMNVSSVFTTTIATVIAGSCAKKLVIGVPIQYKTNVRNF
jgi:hypothetical protein